MADESPLSFILDLDTREAIKKIGDFSESLQKLGDIESLEGIASTLLKVGAVAGVAAAGVLAIKTALDLAVEAEHINQINKSFETLAESAGLSADVIKDQLVGAAKGLADDTEILQAANKAIVSMGANAKALPETMELARKATALFGGELVSNFESINSALASGNVRALRQYGIIIDSEKAQKNYAKSLGISVEYLTEAGKKQAIFNEALEQGKTKFSGVDESSLKTTNSLKRISVALGEIKDIAVLAWDRLAGPTVSKAVTAIADGVHALSVRFKAAFGAGEDKAKAQLELLEQQRKSQRESIEWQLAQLNGSEMYKGRIKELRAELAKLDEEQEKSAMAELKRQSRSYKPKEEEAAAAPQVDYAKLAADRKKHHEEELAAQTKFEKDLNGLTQQRIESEKQIATSIEQVDLLHYQQRELINSETENKMAALKQQYVDKKFISEEQYNQAVYQLEQNRAAQIQLLEEGLADARIAAMERAAAHSKTAMEGITATFAVESAKAKKDLGDYGKLGQTVFGAFKNNAVQAFQALGSGSKDAGQAMKGFVFGAIADIAEAHGQMMLAAGLWPPNPIAIAGGGALIALAGLLRSQSGGASKGLGGGGGGAGAGGGGGAGAAPAGATATEAAMTEAKPAIQQTQQKAVAINISGSYYETEQTRTRLMEMIREAGDFTDFNLKQIGQA